MQLNGILCQTIASAGGRITMKLGPYQKNLKFIKVHNTVNEKVNDNKIK